MKKNKKRFDDGFTLIELTVVLIISSLIVAGAAHAFFLWLVQHRLDVTKDRIAAIEAAVVDYVQENGDLPCAAPRGVDRTDPGYGRETNCAGAAAGTAQADGRDGRKVRIGEVPVRTLDLSDEHRLDGWYKPFSYAVTEVLASDVPLFDSTLGALFVVDESDAPVITPDGSALYVVVSHGYQGDCASGMDAENCDDDATFRAAAFSTAANSSFFDDFAGYATDIEDSTMSNIERCNEKGMDFAPADPAADAEGCIYSPSLADMSCPPGEAMTGFAAGVAQCAALGGGGDDETPSCPSGQVWDGTACVRDTSLDCTSYPPPPLPPLQGWDCHMSGGSPPYMNGTVIPFTCDHNEGSTQHRTQRCIAGNWVAG